MKHISNTPKVIKKTASVGQTAAVTNKLIGAMHTATSMGRTENNAETFIRSGSNLLDFFAQAGAMRGNPAAALGLFKAAFAEDREKALKVLFYLRDVRGGQGERKLFRNALEWVGTSFPEVFEKVITHVPEYGRWDDIFFDNEKVWNYLRATLELDTAKDKPSLLGKWLPTINASSPTTRAKAHTVAKNLGLTEIGYRKVVRELRKKIRTVEEQMSAREWEKINYTTVPSQAARIYKGAFKKHDDARYSAFIEKATTGEVKINAATLYPYQIYKDVQNDYSPALEALWNQLPDYTRGTNALVIADVSGSMMGDPITVSVSLALYFAERNTGQFKDHFMTFSAKPHLQRIVGKTLLEKMSSIERSQWDMNTDLQAAFDTILASAVNNGVPAEEMPSTLYIISDMEFDECVAGGTNYESIKAKYAMSGYTLPTVVFWQVNARSGKNLPVQKGTLGVAMVSGFSPSVFKMVVENKTPEQVMLDVISSERYAPITI